MKLSFWSLLCAIVLAGCIQNQYDIELTPAGKSLDRTLKVKRHGADANKAVDNETKRLGEEYHVAPPADAREQVFHGRFTGRMPDDVGGYGTFTRWETPLGSTAIYAERFRGNDDPSGELKRRQAAANRVVELLVGWFERELKDEPQWPTFAQFLNEDFHRDLLNISIYAWTAGLTERSDEAPDVLLRATQYLVEHGYLTTDEMPQVKRAFDDAKRNDYGRLLSWLKRLILARMSDDVRPPPAVDFLESPERLAGSLRAYLETTEEFAGKQLEWIEALKIRPDAAKPDPYQVATEPLAHLFAGSIQLGGDQVTVALKTGRQPIFSNGSWFVDSAQIKWVDRRLPAAESPPALVYAVWDDPDERAQRKHFGKVVLEGKPLLEYCSWYRGLTDEEQREWDAFVGQLRPGPALMNELNAFRFSHEPINLDKNHYLARPAVDAILGGLLR